MGTLTAIALLVPAINGYLFCSIFLAGDDNSGVLERLAFGYGAGIGILTIEIFLTGLAGIPFTLAILGGLQAVTFTILLCVLYFTGHARSLNPCTGRSGASLCGCPSSFKGSKLTVAIMTVLALWIIFKLCFVLSDGMLRPALSVDTYGHWSAGAKAFYYDRGLMLDKGPEEFFGRAYRYSVGYPLLTPLAGLWIALWTGEFHEVYVTAWAPLYYIALVSLFFTAIKREAGSKAALIGTALLASMPLITYHAIDAYADLPLSCYALSAALCLYRFTGSGERRTLALSGFFLGLIVFTKNSGVIFVVAAALTLALYLLMERREAIKNGFTIFAAFIITAGPWLLFNQTLKSCCTAITVIGNVASGSSGSAEAVGRPALEILLLSLKAFFLTPNFGFGFALWCVSIIFGARLILSSSLRYLYLFTIAVVGMLLLLYMTRYNHYVTTGFGIHRHAIAYVPIMTFGAVIVVKRILRKDTDEG